MITETKTTYFNTENTKTYFFGGVSLFGGYLAIISLEGASANKIRNLLRIVLFIGN